MEFSLSPQESSSLYEIHYNDDNAEDEDNSPLKSPALIFFKDIWKIRSREKTKLYYIIYILALGITVGLISLDMMSLNTIPAYTNPGYEYYNNPYLNLYIQFYSDNFLKALSPLNSKIINDFNNFFNDKYHYSFELENSMKEMKNYLNTGEYPGIGAFISKSNTNCDISLINKNSPESTKLDLYLSLLKFITENSTANHKENKKYEQMIKERSNQIQNQLDQNHNNEENTTINLNISIKTYAHPEMRPTVGYDSLTAFYIILAYYLISIASSTVTFKLNKEKVLFYLNINGFSDFKMYLTFYLSSLLEYLPCTIILPFVVSYIPVSYRDTNVWIILISTILFVLGRTFFNFISTSIFLKFNNFGMHYIFEILFPLVFLFLTLYKKNVPDVVFVVFSLLSPSQAYMMGFSTMAKCKIEIEPLSFHLMNEKFNGMSMTDVFCYQICSAAVMLFLMVLFMLNMDHLYGHSALGWRNMFRKSSWKKLFSPRKNNRISSLDSGTIIKLDNVIKKYNGHIKITALKGVNCNIHTKEAIVLIGPNGSGKSTLIDCIVGTSSINSGSIEFFGENLNGNYSFIYDNLGIVFQDNVLINELTVDEHFELIGALHSMTVRKIEKASNVLLSLLYMSECKKSRAGDLSGGQKRKLCMALALIHKPPFLIFDEPTAGVDAQSRQIIWKVLSLYKDTTSLITSHAIEEAELICSRLFIMVKGLISFMGTPAELRKEANCGYILTIVEENKNMNTNVNVRDNLLSFIQKRIPDAKILEGKEKSIIFPVDLRIADVLEDIDKSKESLWIMKYTISVQNLEESLVSLIENEEVDQIKA